MSVFLGSVAMLLIASGWLAMARIGPRPLGRYWTSHYILSVGFV